MSSYGNHNQKVKMPTADKKFQRIWLKYTLGCLSNGQCEWDYTIKLFVREHTGKNDSTLKQAPYLKVNGIAKDSIAYSTTPTWVNTYNSQSKTTDSSLSATMLLTFYADTLHPLVMTDTLRVYAANYWRYSFDSLGVKTDSTWVPATAVSYQRYTNYYDVFEIVNDIELGRLISPYAKTFPKSFQYDYIYDVTEYAGLFHDSTEFRIQYQGYSYGFTATWDMIMVEGIPAQDVIKVENIYNGGFNYGQSVSIEEALKAKTFTVPNGTKKVKARIIITGHGGENNENCAEFCAKEMYLKLNGTQVAKQLVWKDDCGSNAITAQPGTWVYNRANWCPGEKIRNFDYNLDVTAGSTNTIDLDMEEFTANGAASYNIALQLIYFSDFNIQTDASIEEILAPTRSFWQSRYNPICDNAKFVMKNWGEKPITEITFSYQIGNAPENNLTWNGSLASYEEKMITIPYINWTGGNIDSIFKVKILTVNGTSGDDNAYNNYKEEGFNLPFVLPSSFVIETRTNSKPEQNSYTIKDAYGNVVKERSFTTANTLHKDTISLGFGCYTFHYTDEGGNGLGWWAAPSEGSGSLRMLTTSTPLKVLKSFNTDFGNFVQLNFRVQHALTITENFIKAEDVILYPNPASTTITVEGFAYSHATITDIAGKVVKQINTATSSISIQDLPTGVYLMQLKDLNGQQIVKKFVVTKN